MLCFTIDKSNEKVYVVLEARLSALFKSVDNYEILCKFQGDSLKGKAYQPLFNYFANVSQPDARMSRNEFIDRNDLFCV